MTDTRPDGAAALEGWRLAANYSEALAGILETRPDAVDAIKISEFDHPEYVAAYRRLGQEYPLILHGLGHAVKPGRQGFAAGFQASDLVEALAFTRSEHVSIHLECVLGPGEQFVPDEYLALLTEHVGTIRSASGLPVLLENIHFNRTQSRDGVGNHPITCDPGFIARALDLTGCGLLLDIAHAQVAAWHRGEPVREYLSALPLDLTREVHINGPVWVDGALRDRHGETTLDGYQLLAELLPRLAQAGCRTVTLEYGGVGPLLAGRSDPEVLFRQLLRLRQILAGGQ